MFVVLPPLIHMERVNWNGITHVRLKPGAKGDTPAGKRIMTTFASSVRMALPRLQYSRTASLPLGGIELSCGRCGSI